MALAMREILEEQMDDAWRFLLRATDGIDDVLLHWEPAPGSWGLRLTEGRWRLDYHIPDPLPPGPKTIGWLMGHLAACKAAHYDVLFGSGTEEWDRLDIPGDAEGLMRYLSQAHMNLRRGLDNVGEEDLNRWISTPSDSGEKLTLRQALWFDICHDFIHGGQIFHVRNEFAARLRHNDREERG